MVERSMRCWATGQKGFDEVDLAGSKQCWSNRRLD